MPKAAFSPKLSVTTVPPTKTTVTYSTTTSEIIYDYIIHYDEEEQQGDIYKQVYNITCRINLCLQIATVIFNFLHLIVLFRKDLRTIAIFILMIGIAFSDIITNSLDFINAAGEIEWLPIFFGGSGEMNCLRDDYSEVNIGQQLIATFLDISRRLSVWLAILMAAIRSLSVMLPMSQRVQNMTKPKGAVLTLLACILFWFVFCTWQFALYRVFWLPDNANDFCKNMFKSAITPRYVLSAPENLKWHMLNWGFIEVIMKFAAAICYPILTLSLLVTLRTIKKRRQNLQKKDSEQPKDHTTVLILIMTISFMLSEGLAGVKELLMYNINRITEWNEDFGTAIRASETPINLLRTINALSHPFICFLLSSQYRDTLKGIFVVKRKITRPDFTRSTSNIRSKTSTTTTSF